MNVNPYLILNGTCEAAFTFYAQATGGTLGPMMRFDGAEGCENMPAEHRQKIMHTNITFGQTVLMGSDNHPDYPCEAIKGFSVSLSVDSIADAERIFAALSDGGQVNMPLAQTFWAVRFGMLVDKFGVPWMINCEKDA
ncbi:VOC family protein [Pseudoxanthomonas sp. LjRoot168]|uniref:VOC family protein n=1 Tax=unclassified Pseudoxanthomonas TaxID=2645906 RepID=UPI0025DBF0F9|nr:VOC family protein [Pseudoxanthomonas sp.]